MFDDDQDLDEALSRALKGYAGDALKHHEPAWPRIQVALHQDRPRRPRRLTKLWIIPVMTFLVLASAGTALAVYSHTSPIIWIFERPVKSDRGETVHAYIPPPQSVTLKKAGSLLRIRLALLRGTPSGRLQSVTFQGATTTSKKRLAATDKGSVVLIYSVQGRTVSVREYHAGPGALITRLKGTNYSASARESISVISIGGGFYEIETNAKIQVLYAEWKTLDGVLVILTGFHAGLGQPLPLDFVRGLLPHIS